MQSTTLRIGTRGSPLARAQAEEVANALRGAHLEAGLMTTIVPIRTTGDQLTDRPLLEAGGKGLFTKEIEEALLAGEIDIAVHSAKDLPTALPPGLELAGCLPREDARDAFIARGVRSFAELPHGAVLGTSSLRRRALALRRRPDLKVVEFRGNVGTRLRKLEEGIADATLLAMAGLRRLDLEDHATDILQIADFIPAVGQGAIAVELREGDIETMEFVAPILDADTGLAVAAERAFLGVLDGSCRTPIGGHAAITDGMMIFRGIIVTPDGRTAHETEYRGSAGAALHLGREAGAELARRGGPDFFRH